MRLFFCCGKKKIKRGLDIENPIHINPIHINPIYYEEPENKYRSIIQYYTTEIHLIEALQELDDYLDSVV